MRMDARLTRSDYTIRHAKMCFPGLADGVVQKWRDKGLVSSTRVKKGVSVEHCYDIYGILHLGVLNQMSMVGVFKRFSSDLEIWIEPLDVYLTLGDPETICGAYAMIGLAGVITIWLDEVPLEEAFYRNRRAEVKYYVGLHGDPLRDAMSLGMHKPDSAGILYTNITIRVGMMLGHCIKTLLKAD